MKNRNILFFLTLLCLTFGAISCKDDVNEADDPNDNNNGGEKYELYLAVDKEQVQLFEGANYSMGVKDEDGSLRSIYLAYDSVLVSIDGVHQEMNKDGHHTFRWMQSFNQPGSVKYVAIAYKNNKEKSRVEVNLEVMSNKGDFLSIHWDRAKQNFETFNYMSDVTNLYMDLKYSDRITPHAYLIYNQLDSPKTDEEYIASLLSARKVLTNYINSFYNGAKFTFSGDDIMQSPLVGEYNSRFALPLNKIADSYNNLPHYPLAIWETSTTNIALVAYEYDDVGSNIPVCKVIAEPK